MVVAYARRDECESRESSESRPGGKSTCITEQSWYPGAICEITDGANVPACYRTTRGAPTLTPQHA